MRVYVAGPYTKGDPCVNTHAAMLAGARLLAPGSRVGILHFIVPMVRKPMRLLKVYGITTGCGYAIRAWSVFEKERAGLWEEKS